MCEVKRSEVKGDRGLKEDEVPEGGGGGGGRQMQRETDFVRQACVHEPPEQRLHGQGGEIHTFPAGGGGSLEVWGHKYYLRGAKLSQQAKWEFLLLCESAGIIFITPAAESDPGAAHIENSTCPVGISGELSL